MGETARIDLVDRAPLTEKQQNVYESIMQKIYHRWYLMHTRLR